MKLVGCLLMLLVMLVHPAYTVQAAREALRVWALDVTPSLFPYMLFCRMLAAELRRRRAAPAPAASLLGLLGGSPSGASVLSAYGDNVPRAALFPLAALTGTISPMFLLNTVNTWVQDAQFCRKLLLSHLLGALFAGFVILLLTQSRAAVSGQRSHSSMQALSAQDASAQGPIADCVGSVLNVGGCIVFFSVLAAGIGALVPHAPSQLSALLHAFLEIAGGLHALSAADFPLRLRAVLMAGASGFGGLSILTQNLLFLRPLGITAKQLTAFALLRALGAAISMALMA